MVKEEIVKFITLPDMLYNQLKRYTGLQINEFLTCNNIKIMNYINTKNYV